MSVKDKKNHLKVLIVENIKKVTRQKVIKIKNKKKNASSLWIL
jgi:hypothetical protein